MLKVLIDASETSEHCAPLKSCDRVSLETSENVWGKYVWEPNYIL